MVKAKLSVKENISVYWMERSSFVKSVSLIMIGFGYFKKMIYWSLRGKVNKPGILYFLITLGPVKDYVRKLF